MQSFNKVDPFNANANIIWEPVILVVSLCGEYPFYDDQGYNLIMI